MTFFVSPNFWFWGILGLQGNICTGPKRIKSGTEWYQHFMTHTLMGTHTLHPFIINLFTKKQQMIHHTAAKLQCSMRNVLGNHQCATIHNIIDKQRFHYKNHITAYFIMQHLSSSQLLQAYINYRRQILDGIKGETAQSHQPSSLSENVKNAKVSAFYSFMAATSVV